MRRNELDALDPEQLKPVRLAIWSLRFGVVSLICFVMGNLWPSNAVGDLLCGGLLLVWTLSTTTAVSLALGSYLGAQRITNRKEARRVAIAGLAFVVAQPMLLFLVFVGLALAGA